MRFVYVFELARVVCELQRLIDYYACAIIRILLLRVQACFPLKSAPIVCGGEWHRAFLW